MRYVSSAAHPMDRRPGVVLLVVMAMLALFASLALTFVFYADAEAVSASLNMSTMVPSTTDVDQEALAAYVLGQLLYPTENTNSAVRGWDMARGLYGYNPAVLNFTPFNSDGRLQTLSMIDPDFNNLAPGLGPNTQVNHVDLVNYQIYNDPTAAGTNTMVNFARTPEFFSKYFFGSAAIPPQPSYNVPKAAPKPYRFVGGGNPPWTSYDTNNLVLAQVAADGTVLKPSFYRGWISAQNLGPTQNTLVPSLDPLNPTNVNVFKYMSLRPDLSWNFDPTGVSNIPAFQDPRYPRANGAPVITSFFSPDSDTPLGPDVKNLEFGPGMLVSMPIAPNTGVAATSGASQVQTVPGKALTTITTTLPHGLSPGQTVTIIGVTQPPPPAVGSYYTGYNGSVVVATAPTKWTFTYFSGPGGPVPNVALPPSGGGAVIPQPNQYYTNDSYWMDMGWPVMTAPNGKRFKALVAPLVMCLNNRINLGVHGNRLGNNGMSSVSNQGYGPSEVNPMQLFQLPVAIATLSDAAGTVTVTSTPTPHNLKVGNRVVISNAASPGYNGTYVVSSVLSPTSFQYTTSFLALPVSGGGTFYSPDLGPVVVPISPSPLGTTDNKAGITTVTTQFAHGFNVGDYVIVAGVTNAGYNGAFVVTKVPTANSFQYINPTVGLAKSGNGIVYSGDFKLLMDRRYGGTFFGTPAAWAAAPQRFMSNWTYGGPAGGGKTTISQPVGSAVNFPTNYGTPWYSQTDLDGGNPGVANQSAGITTTPPFAGFATTTTKAIKGLPGAQQTIPVNLISSSNGNSNPWSLTPGMTVVVGNGLPATTEFVQVLAVDMPPAPAPQTFTATFLKNHAVGTPVTSANMGATVSTKGINAIEATFKVTQAMSVATLTGNLPGPPGPSSWTIQAGMTVQVGPPPGAQFIVKGVNAAAGTFSADFNAPFPVGTMVTFVPNSTFPNFTPGYGSGNNIEVQGIQNGGTSPLAYNPFLPGSTLAPAQIINTRPIPSDVESLFRYTGTNAPATLAEIFRIMPNALASAYVRNKVTTVSSGLDRIGAAPYFNFNRVKPPLPVEPANPGYYTAAGGATPTAGLAIGAPSVKAGIVTITTAEPHNFPPNPLPLQTAVRFLDSNLALNPAPGNPPITIQSVPSPNSFTYSLVTYPYLPPAAGVIVMPVPNYAGISPVLANTSVQAVNSEFISNNPLVPGGTDWRSNLGQLLRVNLNRQLTDYPQLVFAKPTDLSGQITNLQGVKGTPGYNQALQDRQQFARDIYNALVRVTGAQDPNLAFPNGTAKTAQNANDYQAARWLAQLAVNIVDFIDNDDYITPFQWYTPTTAVNPANALGEWVFGTELPRVVINEVYAQQETANMHVWAELLNTFNSTNAIPAPSAYPRDNGMALLYNNTVAAGWPVGWPVYQLLVNNVTTPNIGPLNTSLSDPANSLGVLPQFAQINYVGNAVSGNFRLAYGSTPANTKISGPIVFSANAKVLNTNIANAITPLINSYNGVDYMTGVINAGGGSQVTYYSSSSTQAKITVVGGPLLDAKKKPAVQPVPTVVTSSANIVGPGNNPITWNANPLITTTMAILPSNGAPSGKAGSNAGYYVVGPTVANIPAGPRNPNLPTATNTSTSMQMNLPTAPPPGTPGTAKINLMLRRLANPHMPPQEDPTQPLYNPYVTVDYMDQVPTIANPAALAQVAGQTSTGRNQPYSALWTSNQASGVAIAPAPLAVKGGPAFVPGATEKFVKGAGNVVTITTVAPHGFNTGDFVLITGIANPKYNPGTPVSITKTGATTFTYTVAAGGLAPSGGGYATNAAQNTFFGQNTQNAAIGSPTIAYDWITHLDRPPVNVLELLNVSAYRPHLLTQQFMDAGAANRYMHVAPWNTYAKYPASANPTLTAQQSLIYRALDVFGTPSHMNGSVLGGRLQGNVNLNTLMDPFVFRALTDPQDKYLPTNNNQAFPLFSSVDSDSVYKRIIMNRQGTPTDAQTDSQPATNDGTPFKGFATGNFKDTMLRADVATATQSVFTPTYGGNDPARQTIMLQKIMNNITTTSNTFAVWFTVGFFEVVDESVRPPRLGQEVGRSQNSNIRHRFFAVVDRTGMQLFNTSSTNAIPMNVNGAGQTIPPYAWSKTEQYFPGDVVVFTDPATNIPLSYQCLGGGVGSPPPKGGWAKLSMSYNVNLVQTASSAASPAWNAAQSYVVSNTVNIAGVTYFCTQPNIGKNPVKNIGVDWQPVLQPGMLLELDANTPNAEVVAVASVGTIANGLPLNSFQAVFTKPHAIGCSIVCRGNPGPQTNYNPHKDNNVVLHLSVIK